MHQHVSAFGIYNASTADNSTLRFRDLLAHFERHLQPSKIFRRRLLPVSHNLDRPYWVNDPDLDIEFHVRHIALPQPGDRRQLMIQLARLHSRALDLGKPLWEIYVIEGLDNVEGLPPDSFAVFLKVHHAALDTAAALRLVRDIHATSPSPANAEPMRPEVIVSDREVAPLQLYGNVLGHSIGRALRTTRLYSNALARGASLGAQQLLASVRSTGTGRQEQHGLTYKQAPHTRFSTVGSPNRVIDAVQLPLQQIHVIRQQLGRGSVDDVYLTVVSGALRQYLKTKNELPEESLRALFSLQLEHHGTPSSRASRLPTNLFTELRDPVARMMAIRDELAGLRRGPYAKLGARLLPQLLSELPNFAAHRLLKNLLFSQVNCIVSNVRGPAEPMYIAGARALQFCPVGMLTEGVGLNITGFSYDGQLTISFAACRSAMPDPAQFALALTESFEDLCFAAAKKKSSDERRRARRTSRTPYEAAAAPQTAEASA